MRRVVAAIAAGAMGVVASAQSVAPPQNPSPPAGQTPQFRSRIDLVHLDVSVLDANRRPVRGLTPADFRIVESGKPQEISAFAAVDVPAPSVATAPWIRDVGFDVRSNEDVRERRLFVLAIDDATIQNNPFAMKSVKEIARSVINRLGPQDLASVVFTRDNSHSQDFTSDRSRLLAAADSFTGGFRDMGKGLKDITTGPSADDLWYMYSVGVLERAVDYLADVPERRKAIIYIGQGLPFDPEVAAAPVNAKPPTGLGPAVADASMLALRIKDQLNDVFDRAQRANVQVYTVDACGQRVPPPNPVPPGYVPTCVPGLEIDYLVGVAAATGARPVVNSNDFEPGLTAIFEENSSYYLLGYQSGDPTRDGRFRKLEVVVNRPGVTVRTRTGYDAPRDLPEGAKPRATPSALGTALAGVLPKSDLPMQIMAVPFATAGKPDVSVAIGVGFRQPIREMPERLVENVELQVAAFNADGRSFGNTRGQADVTIRPSATGPAEYEVFTTIALKPGRYQLRIAANVGSLTTAGSAFIDVDVPDFAAAPVSMSGLLLTVTPSPPFGPKEALGALVPIVPTTRRQFATTHKVSAFARVYQGGSARAQSLKVRSTVRDASDAVVFDATQDLAAGQFGKDRAADVRLEVPIATLKTGPYVLTLETSAGATTARRNSRFEVIR